MTFALITGSSGGIGLDIAQQLAKRNYGILLVARSENKLRENCKQLIDEFGVEAHYLTKDLTHPHADQDVIAWVEDNKWPLSILVNNAGYGIWGNLEDTPPDDVHNMIQLNVNVLVGLCARSLPLLSKQPQAYILNVASTVAYQAIPYFTAYAASKAFVLSFTRGLRWELKDSTISVSCVSPGATETQFAERADMHELMEKAKAMVMSSQKAAQIAVKGMFAKKAEIIPGAMNKISVALVGLIPKNITEKIAKSVYRKPS